MLSRLAAGAVVIATLLAGVTPCAGWQPSAQARHDCCQANICADADGAGGASTPQDAADRCCAASEDRSSRDSSLFVSVFMAVPPLVMTAAHVQPTVPHDDAVAPATRRTTLPAAPLHLLFSVFIV